MAPAALPEEAAARLLAGLLAAVVEVDGEGSIAGWHAGAERIFGWEPGEVLGRPLELLLVEPPEPGEALALGNGNAIDLFAGCRRRNGETFVAAISIRGRNAGGSLAVIRPLSAGLEGGGDTDLATPQLDRTLARVVSGLRQLAGTELAAIERTDTLARVLVEEARRMLPGTEVMFSLVPFHRQDSFQIIAGSGPWAEAQVGREWLREGTVAGRAMQLRQALETVHIEDLSVLRRTLAAGHIKAARLVPLWTREPLPDGRDAIGVLGWYRNEQRYFTPYERQLMSAFSRLASLLLQRTELTAAAARSAARVQAVVEAAHDLTRSLQPEEILSALVDRGMQLTTADRAAVLQVENGRMSIVAGQDADTLGPPVGTVLPIDAMRTDEGVALVQRVFESGSPAMAGGYHVEGIDTGLDDDPVRNVVAVPVSVASRPLLVLVFSRRRDEPFTEDDVAMLEMVAGIAGLALRNASLYGQVAEGDRLKSDFLNMAAHELRTPLTVIRGYLSMTAEGSFGEIPDAWKAPLDLLREKCEELGRLVEELLLAARLETGRVVVNPRQIDLNELARQAVEAVRPRARAHNASIRFEGARRPLMVVADPEHILRLLDALLSNSLAYSRDEPWIRVRVRAAPKGQAEIEVEDRGSGIDPAQHEVAFERFVRLDSNRQVAGTGLGLYVARELARLQGGRLTLEWSTPGYGSRFLLSLPELGDGD